MKLLLLKCAICDHWYSPDAHSFHCPVCGSLPLQVGERTKYYYLDDSMLRAIEVVRSVPRSFEKTVNCQ